MLCIDLIRVTSCCGNLTRTGRPNAEIWWRDNRREAERETIKKWNPSVRPLLLPEMMEEVCREWTSQSHDLSYESLFVDSF